MSKAYLDLSGVLSVQQNYLANIKQQNINNPDLSAKLDNLQRKLQSSYTSFQGANLTSANILDHQKEMSNIIEIEKKRLEMKKQNIDSALESQKRMIELNDTFRQRYADYVKMMVILAFTLFIIICLAILQRNIPVIPTFVFEILYIFVIVIGLYMMYYKYTDISRRDRIHYNELDLASPINNTPDQIAKQQAESSKYGNLLGTINIGGCIGPQCCSGNTVWDASNSVCIVGNTVTGNTVSGFTTVSGFKNISDQQFYVYNGSVSPNTPNEFTNYAKI